jgi:site-specific recombinase XerD
MLEKLFNDDSCQRLLAGPMGPHLEALSSKLAELGYCDSQARKVVCTAAALGDWLAERGLTPAEAGRAELKSYIEAQQRMPSGRLRDGAVGFSRLPALLEAEGVLCKPSPDTPADPCLRRFSAYLANVRGVTPSTQWTYRRFVGPLVLGLCEANGPDWSKLTSDYVSNYVLGTTSEVRAAKGRVVSAVRTFLHFLVLEGVAPAQMVKAIPRVRRWRYAKLPKHLSADELALVLAACETQSKTSLRDRAFIALLARLGMRCGELRALRLQDVEWTTGLLHIRQSKSGRGRTLPLPEDAGRLLARYIREERPVTEYREIFITSTTPRKPLGECSASSFVKIFLQQLGLDGPGRGSHSFRHTVATLMVKNGATLKEVADVLGHRSLSTTGIYIKLDEQSLGDVALPWSGGNV